MRTLTGAAPLRTPRFVVVVERRRSRVRPASYEHPYVVRLTHWISAVSIAVMILSGIEIFRAFPSFGAKIPEHDLARVPASLGLGGWLGGGLQWHLTFMWPLMASGVAYLAYQIGSGNYRQVLFTRRDLAGVWPMVRYYCRLGPRPRQKDSYNPLQRLAYTSAILLGALAVVTGLALWKPVQLSLLLLLLGGFGWARVWHFAAMLGLVAFIAAHLVMVALHGWNNLSSMLTGWKRGPAGYQYGTKGGRHAGTHL